MAGCWWSHHYVKYGRRYEGRRQYHCTKCGNLKWKSEWSPLCFFFGWHRFRLDRRRWGRTLVCKRCGEIKQYGPAA